MWITTRLRDEHRSALTWLNEHTDRDVTLFGIELSVVRIGASARAPVLDVVIEPNSRRAEQLEQGRQGHPAIRTPRPRTSNWSSFASGPFGYHVAR